MILWLIHTVHTYLEFRNLGEQFHFLSHKHKNLFDPSTEEKKKKKKKTSLMSYNSFGLVFTT